MAFLRRDRLWWVLPFAAFILGIAAFDLAYHEFWRDEIGALLEARAVPWGSFLSAMRLEGVPPLFHALLKLASVVLPNPLALVFVGALDLGILLYGTYRLLVAISGAPRKAALLTFALSLTYVYTYELGVVIRQYTLGLGLALLSFAYLREALDQEPRRANRRAVSLGALCAALSALASAHSACVAGGGLLSFGLISIARRRPFRAWWPVLLTLPCFVLVAFLAIPFPGRTSEANLVQELTPRLAFQALVEGFMPSDWWYAESFLPGGARLAAAVVRSLAFWCLLASASLGLSARLLSPRARSRAAFDLVAVVAGWGPLLVVIVKHYWGFYRHHLFLGLPLVVILAGWGIDNQVAGRFSGALRRAGLALLAPWFLLQVGLSVGCLVLDYRYPFSDTKSAARMLPPRAHVVSDTDWRVSGLLFWRPDLYMRTSSWMGKRFLYTRPDTDWHKTVPLTSLIKEECSSAKEAVYAAAVPASLGPFTACTQRIDYPRTPFETQPSTWESFDLYKMDCTCVAAHR